MCDVVITSSYVYHQGMLVPHRIVFTRVRDEREQYVVELDPLYLEFTYLDNVKNFEEMKQAFVPCKTTSHTKVFRTSPRAMRVYLANTFYKDHIQQNVWSEISFGCVDTATFLYVMDLFPRVCMLDSTLMDKKYELLNWGADPLECGRVAAVRLQGRLLAYHAEDFWDV